MSRFSAFGAGFQARRSTSFAGSELHPNEYGWIARSRGLHRGLHKFGLKDLHIGVADPAIDRVADTWGVDSRLRSVVHRICPGRPGDPAAPSDDKFVEMSSVRRPGGSLRARTSAGWTAHQCPMPHGVCALALGRMPVRTTNLVRLASLSQIADRYHSEHHHAPRTRPTNCWQRCVPILATGVSKILKQWRSGTALMCGKLVAVTRLPPPRGGARRNRSVQAPDQTRVRHSVSCAAG